MTRTKFPLSALWGGEGRGEVKAIPNDGGRPPHPPAQCAGPSLSPLRGGEGLLTLIREGSGGGFQVAPGRPGRAVRCS
jgi:hypothetical protein